ncbi:hypothetical protein B0H14DRAFT_3738112 [Mycena olivaceomarginata]|nr:hypothetical protein B0H14DRAFT_3738112 [Mycena olivaceomarginata]
MALRASYTEIMPDTLRPNLNASSWPMPWLLTTGLCSNYGGYEKAWSSYTRDDRSKFSFISLLAKLIYFKDMYYVVYKVKVNIGAAEIKALAWAQLGPKWVQYSHGYDLHVDDCTIHNKDWVEIIPTRSPDVNAIADRFYKPNPKAPNERIFKTGEFLVYFCIPWSIYSAFLDYDTQRQSQEIDNANRRTDSRQTHSLSGDIPQAHFSSGGCLNPASFSARPLPDQDDGKENNVLNNFSQSTGTQKSSIKLDDTSHVAFKTSVPPLSKDALAKALSQQTIPSRQEMGSLMIFTTISVQASIAQQRNWFDLLSSSGKFESFLESPPRDAVPHLNLTPKAQKRGWFQKASFGRSSVPLFETGSTEICAKQTFYEQKDNKTGAIHVCPFPNSLESILITCASTLRILHRGREDLAMEVKCNIWAACLLDDVYAGIDTFMAEEKTPPPTQIPRMRFVRVAFATEGKQAQVTNGEKTRPCSLFLVEESIEETQ